MQLVINTRGSLLRRRGERFEIRANEQSHEFSAKKVHSIVIATGVRLTSDAIELASDQNVDIVFLNSSGNPTSRVWQTRMGSTATIRRRQLEASLSEQGMLIAMNWISTKLGNQTIFLNELKSRRPKRAASIDVSIGQITSIQAKVQSLQDQTIAEPLKVETPDLKDQLRNTVMGFEGTAGRIYFGTLSNLLPGEYRFESRSRRPATDAFNAMLNYSYGVLYSQVERALILAGLDPFIGFFHTDNYSKPSLVFDLIEPFRIIGEQTTLKLFTGRRAKAEFFRAVTGGIELAPEGRSALVESLNSRLDKTVRYPVQDSRKSKPGPKKHRNIKLRETIRHEAHSLANSLLNKNDIPPLVTTENIFGTSESSGAAD